MITNSTKPAVPLVLRLMQFSFNALGPVFPKFFSERAYQLWFTPPRFNPPETERQALLEAENSTLFVNDIPIRVYRWGSGPLVLFIHGWSGRGSQAAHFVEALISQGYAVLSFDAPAHGATPGKQTNMLAISEVVRSLHQHFGDFHAAITHSFGGMVLPFAIKQGVRVGRIACICPADSLDVILDNFRRQLNIPDKVIQLMRAKLYLNYGADLAEKVSTLRNVATLKIPGLVIHDEDDSDIPWQSGQRVAEAWPNASFILTHRLGHRRILRDTETVKTVVDFVVRR